MENKNDFQVKTEVFSGPLDLLLHLIEKRKLLINEISLSKITDDYINYLKENRNSSINNESHFILIASTLLLIKSKSLLPTIELTEEEEQSIEDLERRLKIYKRIKSMEPQISEIFLKNPTFFKRDVKIEEISFRPTKQIEKNKLLAIIQDLIKRLPAAEKIPKAMIKKVISLEEMINRLTDRVKQGINMSFKDFSNFGKEEKINVIIGFLAMLQLVKDDIIEVEQKTEHSDIDIQTKEFITPDYS